MLGATSMTGVLEKGHKLDKQSPVINSQPAKYLKKVLNDKNSLEHPGTHKYGKEKFPRPFSGMSQNDAVFELRALQSTPGPGAYNADVPKKIKGGQFLGNRNQGHIESLCWRAAAMPGPAHYNVDVEFQGNVHTSILSRISTSRIGFNNTRGSFSMSGVPSVTQSVKSMYCVCANNWTCHFCSGAPKRAPSSIHKHLVSLKQHRFHSDSDPKLVQLRAVSPHRGHTRSGKVVFAQNH
jgi:hypothetical protein